MSEQFLTTPHSLRPSLARPLDALCDQFEAAWRAGQRPLLEEYLQGQAEADQAELLRELLSLELAYRRKQNERPTLEEYQPRFPQQRSIVENAFAADELEDVALPEIQANTQEVDAGRQRFQPELPAIPGYEILDEIGRGGMGAVLRVRDLELERTLAVKIMLPKAQGNAAAEKRFLDEARITGQLQHPGIPPVHELGRVEDGRPFFAMKLIKGRTLAELLRAQSEPVADFLAEPARHDAESLAGAAGSGCHDPRLLTIFGQICQTIGYAHSRGVIHRDLKPSNVMVGAFGEVQLMDWGLAKLIAELGQETDAPAGTSTIHSLHIHGDLALSQTGEVMGTPAYMSPEQARGEIRTLDTRCDVFGLGAILCELLTAAPPFWGMSVRDMIRQALKGDLADAFARLDQCPANGELIDLARACLAPDKEQRPRDALEVAAAVERYQANVQERLRQAEVDRAGSQARAEEEHKRFKVERQRKRVTMALAALIVLVLLGVGGMAIRYAGYAQQKQQAIQGITIAQDQLVVLQEHQLRLETGLKQLKEMLDQADKEAADARFNSQNPNGVRPSSLGGNKRTSETKTTGTSSKKPNIESLFGSAEELRMRYQGLQRRLEDIHRRVGALSVNPERNPYPSSVRPYPTSRDTILRPPKSYAKKKPAFPLVRIPDGMKKPVSAQEPPKTRPVGPSEPDAVRQVPHGGYTETVVKGTLSDETVEEAYRLPFSAGKTYVIDMEAPRFDAYLRLERLEDEKGAKVAEDDNGGLRNDARIVFSSTANGSYRIVATSAQLHGRGNYQITIREFTVKK